MSGFGGLEAMELRYHGKEHSASHAALAKQAAFNESGYRQAEGLHRIFPSPQPCPRRVTVSLTGYPENGPVARLCLGGEPLDSQGGQVAWHEERGVRRFGFHIRVRLRGDAPNPCFRFGVG